MPELLIVESEKNISDAWAKVFLRLCKETEISPLIVSVTGFDDSLEVPENKNIREALDLSLSKNDQSSVLTVANTIFPWSLWNLNKPREELYKRHDKILPSIESCQSNYHGHYFRRMISYENDDQPVNQLEKIFALWQAKVPRHSGLQMAFFDPRKDHRNSPYLGFPCLHQISFDSYGRKGNGGFGITAFYATQHIYRKAYGNYLGLCRLGKFIEKERGSKFVRLNCIAGLAKFYSGFRKTSTNTKDLKRFIIENVDTE